MYCFAGGAGGWNCQRTSVRRGPRWFCAAADKAAERVAERGSRLALIGLGNPGREFKDTRHNIGFEIIDTFAARHGGRLSVSSKFQAECGDVQVGDRRVVLAKPLRFMNLSGMSVKAIVDFYKIPLRDVLVVTDDINIELGALRLRAKGSAGGHNGLKNIQQCLRTQEYPRLRVGVGSPNGGDLADFVLGNFSRTEAPVLEDTMWDCMDVLDAWTRETDLSKVMNVLAKKKHIAGEYRPERPAEAQPKLVAFTEQPAQSK